VLYAVSISLPDGDRNRTVATPKTAPIKTLWRAGFSPRGALAPPYAGEAEASRGEARPLRRLHFPLARRTMRHSLKVVARFEVRTHAVHSEPRP
jgi:hypothetical protein